MNKLTVRSQGLICSALPRFAVWLSAGICFAALSLACSSSHNTTYLTSEDKGSPGELRLELTAISESETVYQLRNAEFTITSIATGEVLVVEASEGLNETSLLVPLQPGSYRVFLRPGHVLEVAPAQPVNAVLLSGNPAMVVVEANLASSLRFVFQVNFLELQQENFGLLSIGLKVIEGEIASNTCSDEIEPNGSLEESTIIDAAQNVDATLCAQDEDHYVFLPPVASGKGFTVTLEFLQEQGDIDAVLFNSQGQLVAGGVSTTDNEMLGTISDGEPYHLAALLFASSVESVAYSVSMGAESLVGQNSCCEASAFPGCAEPQVQQCVCSLSPLCCQVGFNSDCTELADFGCQAACSAPAPAVAFVSVKR